MLFCIISIYSEQYSLSIVTFFKLYSITFNIITWNSWFNIFLFSTKLLPRQSRSETQAVLTKRCILHVQALTECSYIEMEWSKLGSRNYLFLVKNCPQPILIVNFYDYNKIGVRFNCNCCILNFKFGVRDSNFGISVDL